MRNVILLTLGIVLLTGAAAWGADPKVQAELSRRRIFEGQSVIYRVTVENVSDSERPVLSLPEGLTVEPRGESRQNSIVIINNRRQELRGTSYDYLITPQGSGEFEIPAPRVEVAGSSYAGPTLRLEVVPPDSQDTAVVELEVDRTTVYPMQPFTVTLRVFVKQLPPPNADRQPVRLIRSPPRLSIPWVHDDALPEGVKPSVPWQRWLATWRNRRSEGFRINGIRDASLFSLFDEGGMGFLPTAQKVTRPDAQRRPVGYWVYEFPREFTASKLGKVSFGPARLEGYLAVAGASGRRLEPEDVYAFARPVSIEVVDVPSAGRPVSYVDAIGEFQVDAELQPQQARLGDPLTLTITLSGAGLLDTAKAPELAAVPEVSKHFRVYEPTSTGDEQSRQFVYSIRPLDTKAEAFPSIPVSYFDVEAQQYVTLQTGRIPLEILPSERLSGGEIATASGSAPDAVEETAEGIRANLTDVRAVRDDRVRPLPWLLGMSGLGGVYVVMLVAFRQWRRRGADVAQLQRNSAIESARQQLIEADKRRQSGQIREAADRTSAAVVELVAAAAAREPAGLTTHDAAAQLRRLEVDPKLVHRTQALLEFCDATRYGGAAALNASTLDEANDLANELIEFMRSLH